MKKLLAIILAAAIIFSFAGCSGQALDSLRLEDSPYNGEEFYTSRSIYVKTQYSEYGDIPYIWFYIANYSTEDTTYTAQYSLEKYTGNNKWGTVPFKTDKVWDASLLPLTANSTVGFSFNLSDFNYDFTAGKYRIVKQLGDKLCAGEFTIGDSGISSADPYGYCDMSQLPAEFTLKDAIDSNTAAITSGNNYHTDKILDFVKFSSMGMPSMVRIARYGDGNALTFTDVIYDGTSYTWKYDNTRDPDAENPGVSEETRSYIITDGISIYLSDYPTWPDSVENGASTVYLLTRSETTVMKDILNLLVPTTYAVSAE